MARRKTDLAVINRGFWPQGQVIGEGLLQFAEKAAEDYSVCVITQAEGDLSIRLANAGRGKGVRIFACKPYTTSASGVIQRIVEATIFMLWTFISLVRTKPANVYVSTNPPVLVPFVVAVYCCLFRARYVYHLQDIHPEAANIVVPLNGLIFRLLQAIDNFTLRHASAIVTLSEDMKDCIQRRSNTRNPIHLLDNPSYDVAPRSVESRTKDIIFCGNAGRLQRIPLLLAAIREYLGKGGKLRFTFAGGGLHALDVESLADTYERVEYLGVISAVEAAELVNQHRWALLPIDDEVTKYAFPSKSSGYVLSGVGVLAICGSKTSVARWVVQNEVGIVCEPELEALVNCFFSLEGKTGEGFLVGSHLRNKLQLSYFAGQLCRLSISNSKRDKT